MYAKNFQSNLGGSKEVGGRFQVSVRALATVRLFEASEFERPRSKIEHRKKTRKTCGTSMFEAQSPRPAPRTPHPA